MEVENVEVGGRRERHPIGERKIEHPPAPAHLARGQECLDLRVLREYAVQRLERLGPASLPGHPSPRSAHTHPLECRADRVLADLVALDSERLLNASNEPVGLIDTAGLGRTHASPELGQAGLRRDAGHTGKGSAAPILPHLGSRPAP